MNTLLQAVAANQRFLGKTNPIMTAAVADGGSIQDREYIQRAARSIVDAGLWGNLKLWVDPGLVKLRNSGGVDYIPKAYDLSGNGYNETQTTEANQPTYYSDGLYFDGTDTMTSSSPILDSEGTIMMYVKVTSPADSLLYRILRELGTNTNRFYLVFRDTGSNTQVYFTRGTNTSLIITDKFSTNAWFHCAITWKASTLAREIYINATREGNDSYTAVTAGGNVTFNLANIGAGEYRFVGRAADIRSYNIVLTGDQITAIYNATKYRYGL